MPPFLPVYSWSQPGDDCWDNPMPSGLSSLRTHDWVTEGTWLCWASDLIIKESEMGTRSKSISLFPNLAIKWELLMTIFRCDKASGWPQNTICVWREAEAGLNGGCRNTDVPPTLLLLEVEPLRWPRSSFLHFSQSPYKNQCLGIQTPFFKILITFFPHIRYYLLMLFLNWSDTFFLNTFNLKRKFHVKAVNQMFTEFCLPRRIMEVEYNRN